METLLSRTGVYKWKGDATNVVFAANGKWATVSNHATTTLIEISNGREVLKIGLPMCAFSASGNLAYAWKASGKSVEVWDLSRGEPVPLAPIVVDPEAPLPTADVTKLLLADDGLSYLQRWLPSYGWCSVFLGDKSKPIEYSNRNANRSAVWSRDGRMIASGSFTGIAQVRLRADGFRDKWMIGTHGNGVDVVRVSPDSKTLATGGANGQINLWDVSALHELALAREAAVKDEPRALALDASNDNAPDQGQRLAPSAHVSQQTRSALQPKFIRTIKAHLQTIKSLEFSSDGRNIVSYCSGVKIPVANPSGDDHAEVWGRNLETYVNDIIGGNNYRRSGLEDNCGYCPTEAQDGPYDQEILQSLVNAGVLLTDSYLRDDLAYPSTISMEAMVTPNSLAPNGPSFSNPDGPILPTSIFPLNRQGEAYKNGTLQGDWDVLGAFALDGQSLQHIDEDGTTHDLDYTGLNYSHVAFGSGAASTSRPWGLSGTWGQVGDYAVIGKVLDVDGNGWEIASRWTVVAEPTDVVGDLNYNGELDLGDLNIMTQNVSLMPIDGHEYSEDQLRLDMNGDESVDVSDIHHWVTTLKSTWILVSMGLLGVEWRLSSADF